MTTQANHSGTRTPHQRRAAPGSVLSHNALARAGRAVAGHAPPRGFFGQPPGWTRTWRKGGGGRGSALPGSAEAQPSHPCNWPWSLQSTLPSWQAPSNRDAENALPGPQNSECLGHNVTTLARKNKTTKKETPKKGLAVGPVPGSGSAAHRTAQG